MVSLQLVFLATVFLCVSVTGNDRSDVDKKIVGGENAPEGAYPYQVSLRKKGMIMQYHMCGGSIINPRWVVTAAHCTIDETPKDLTIVVGSNKILTGGTKHEVTKVINHESYSKQTIENDIALLQVVTEFSYNSRVAAIALADEDTAGGVKCVVTGWGYINRYGLQTNTLQVLNVTTITYKECVERYNGIKDSITFKLSENHVCTYKARGEGVCQGDSGGPLMADNKLVGIVSWGVPCAEGYPDVYTRVYSYVDWINKHLS